MLRRPALHISALLIAAMLLAMTPAFAASDGAGEPFGDIAGHWAEADMRRASSQGIIHGDGQSLMPDDPISAAQIAAILVRALGGSEHQAMGSLTIPAGKWYTQDLLVAKEMGFLPGGITNYEAPLPRHLSLRMVLDAFALDIFVPDLGALEGFSDSYDYDASVRRTMAVAVSSGLVVGDGGLLRARDGITRAEFITVLYRAARSFGTILQGEKSVAHGDTDLSNKSVSNSLWLGISANNIKLQGVQARDITVRSGALESLELDAKTRVDKLVLASNGSDVELELQSNTARAVVVGQGRGAVSLSGEAPRVDISGEGRTVTLDGDFTNVTVIGSGARIYIAENSKIDSLEIYGSDCRVTLDGFVSCATVNGEGAGFEGGGTVGVATVTARDFDEKNPPELFTEIQYNKRAELGDMSITLNAPASLPAGETLRVTATLPEAPEGVVLGSWFIDGELVVGSAFPDGLTFKFELDYVYSRDMSTQTEITLEIRHFSMSGELSVRMLKAVVQLENYGEEYYYRFDYDRVLELVTSPYMGNYTLEYAQENDYEDYEKEIWVNAKGYSSDSQYLVWVNIAYQRVNIFEGSEGEWTLIRSSIVGTGAPGTGTPVGVWKTTYKQDYGWTTGTYTVRPVVGFKSGGYAFHSRLYYPGTQTLSDPSIGFPISHGCIRMYQEDIDWIFDNVPDGTTVVVF